MVSRVAIGFHRLGIVIAAPCLIGAAVLATVEWKNAPEGSGIMTPEPPKAADQDPYAGYSVQPPALRQQAAPYAGYSDQPPPKAPAPGPSEKAATEGIWAAMPDYSGKTAAEIAAAAARKPDYNLAWLIAAVGVFLYAVSRAAGWAIAGFLGR